MTYLIDQERHLIDLGMFIGISVTPDAPAVYVKKGAKVHGEQLVCQKGVDINADWRPTPGHLVLMGMWESARPSVRKMAGAI